jgi:ATP-dependent phosphofructokinase / diphosphate-dependent phosphofructokinase
MAKKIGLLTGGGDCPGLNPALRGAVMCGLDYGFEFVGFLEGWRGLVEGNTQPVTLADVKEIVGKGGTFLGSSRTNPFKKEGAVEKCLANFKKFDLHALVACGGEDTLGVAARLYKEHKVNVVGVPKTMDNDLSATDYTFGFDTATTVAVDALERLRDTGRSHRRIMVLEVMGRHAGWVALYASIAAAADWVLLPERTCDVKAMCAHLQKVHKRDKTALVVTSEAVELPGMSTEGEQLDQFGHMLLKNRGLGEKVAGLIEKETGIETRSAVIGHIQRGGAPTLFDRILATRAGAKAADMIQAGDFGKMAAMRGIEMVAVPLSEATSKLKTVSPDWLKLADTFFK